ncbi:MAG: NUDIX hydrolase [Clostridiaceae bacterium]|nr:NUDIX hydrolase [Clostridiaceae bacterium]
MYVKITKGLIQDGKSQSVFLIPFARECQVYRDYDETGPQQRELLIPLVLMQLRWDGTLGFPGGLVNKGEDLIQAVIRESKEEFAFIINEKSSKEIKLLSTYADESINIHSYYLEISYEKIKEIQRNSTGAKHFYSENQGCILPQIADFKGRGIKKFLTNNFYLTAKEELKDLIKTENLLNFELD